MTRINVGIDPATLCDQMLLAEHREIKRIPNAVKSGRAVMHGIPANLTLGKGHVRFFYNKLGYLLERYKLIYKECLRRGFCVTPYFKSWDSLCLGGWKESSEDTKLLQTRINYKLEHMKTNPRFKTFK